MSKSMSMSEKGRCYLVGAGPGDLGLVTLRAKELIGRADVILYDALCNPEMLSWARDEADIIFVGKRAGEHSVSQKAIDALLVEKASAAKSVVRLKGGDPFVFGRGAEEAEALANARIEFEIVPGITSAVAAPAYAGIPLTHRERNSTVTFFTGHEDPEKGTSAIDFQALAKLGGTQVMLMGMERLETITRNMIESGARSEMPAAVVQWGTTGRQKTVVGTLVNLAQRAKEAGIEAPAISIFGEVVSLRGKLDWFEKRSLFGKRIVVTRTRKQASALNSQLRELGADVLEIPTIRIEPPTELREFAELVQDAHSYDWIVFTSTNGADAFFEIFFKLYDDAREIGAAKIAAIGPATAQRVKDLHLHVDLQPPDFVAEGMVKEFEKIGGIENLRVLVARAERARDLLPKALARMGAIVDEGFAYKTIPETRDVTGARARFSAEGADLITFTSSSTVENFLDLKLSWPAGMKVASIGPITSATARERGLSVDVEAKQHDIPGLVAAISRFYGA
jgi:uroporphyrinogen III methyltransferase / synthase